MVTVGATMSGDESWDFFVNHGADPNSAYACSNVHTNCCTGKAVVTLNPRLKHSLASRSTFTTALPCEALSLFAYCCDKCTGPVGVVSPENRASFSSMGSTLDGRIKPGV